VDGELDLGGDFAKIKLKEDIDAVNSRTDAVDPSFSTKLRDKSIGPDSIGFHPLEVSEVD